MPGPYQQPDAGSVGFGGTGPASGIGVGLAAGRLQSNPSLVSVAVTPAAATVKDDATQVYVASGTFSDGHTATVTPNATFDTSNHNLATFVAATLTADHTNTGTCSVSATVSGITGTTTVNITPSGFDPNTISGLVGWYDASTLGLADAAAVDSWTDGGPNAKHLVGTTTTRPVQKTNIKNSLSIVRFDGTDDYVVSTSFGAYTQPNMIFVIASGTVDGQQNTLFDSVDTTAHAASIDSRANGLKMRTTAQIAVGDTIQAFKLYTFLFSGASSYCRVNGSQVLAGDIGTSGLTNLLVGKGGGATFWGAFGGDIGEIVIYNAALSGGDRGTVETALISKWAIS